MIYKKVFYYTIALAIAATVCAGCGSNAGPQREKAKKSRLLAVVNNYKMSVGDFYQDVRPILKNKLLTEDPSKEKSQILEELIQKEILIQEAQRLNLDKEKDFMREIEQYWKQALIKSLILKKQKEFARQTQVFDSEIKDEYELMKREASGEIKPFEELAPGIRNAILSKKVGEKIDNWISELRKAAAVKVYDEALNAISLDSDYNQGGR